MAGPRLSMKLDMGAVHAQATADDTEWRAAAGEGVPWETVRDELRQQVLLSDEEKDRRPATELEKGELVRRRSQLHSEMLRRLPSELNAMRAALVASDEAETVRGLLRGARLAVLDELHHEGGEVGELWASDVSRAQSSRRWIVSSAPAERLDFFVSHSWHDDGDSKGLRGKSTERDKEGLAEFGRRKAVALQNVVRTAVEMDEARTGRRPDRSEWLFWMDKVCIPQFDEELKLACVTRLEAFIGASARLIVLLTPRYLRRLWCVYEWSCFLASKGPEQLLINHRSFSTAQNARAYRAALSALSVDGCECSVEEDRGILRAKVGEYYASERAFEDFVRFSMVALIVRDYYSYPPLIKTSKLFAEHAEPWVRLALDLGFVELHSALRAFDVPTQYAAAEHDDRRYMPLLEQHMRAHVYPLIHARRAAACTERGRSLWDPRADAVDGHVANGGRHRLSGARSSGSSAGWLLRARRCFGL